MKKARRASAAVAVGSLLAGAAAIAIGLVGVGAAGAATLSASKTFTYSCTLPLLGATNFDVTVSADVPDSVTVGDPIHLDNFQTTVVTPASVTSTLSSLGIASVEGGASVTNEITDNGTTHESTFDATVPNTPVPSDGSALTTIASATVPDYTTTAAGSVVLGSGPFTVTLHGLKPDGTNAGLDNLLTFPCTPPSDATLATVNVVEPTPTTSSSPPTDTSTPTSPGSGPTTSAGNGPTTSAGGGQTTSAGGGQTTSPGSQHTANGANENTLSQAGAAVGSSGAPSADASLASSSGSLANTGVPSGLLVGLGALLIVGGAGTLLIARRWPGRHTA